MTAQGEDILAWTNDAISMREAAATAAAAPYGGRWAQGLPERHKDPDMRYGWDQDMVHLSQEDPYIAYQCLSDEIAAHTVLHDPESVLRRCAADRKLMELHSPVTLHAGAGARYFETTRVCKSCEPPKQFPETAYPCPTIVSLAEGYGWMGGER
jgi:hypothetical protein